ncbi:MFS transporter [Achromobacter marplatensis]|uniref:DHA2 family multidrug resistance protein-like MFS transporter n=1 Tax=Achromobacter marplatensis TaxID=470868 RepID=A0ABX9G4Y7_9BURK|nr:MFS transporter [Achromobacter marplatensis]RBP15968.1 DHA2 family multidrug resistance protein-like MFS transporter [Achromobacter marplatensis]CAB3691912.1 Riboflavin transporter RibZ [Achromobacter marplatensis]
MPASALPSPTPLTPATRRYAMLAVSLSISMATLDTSMTNTALPSIASQLGVSASDVIGVVTIYQLVMVATMLPLAALAGKIGHRRVFMPALWLFLLASIWCGAAPTLWSLEAARAVQGLAAAALMGCNMALVSAIYPKEQLGRGMGLNAMIAAASLAGGPVLASAMLTVLSWHWLFYVNVPFCLVALALAGSYLPRSPGDGKALDAGAALLCALAFGLTVLGLERVARPDWGVALIWVLGGACWVLLLCRERLSPHAIVPRDLLRLPPFSTAVLICVLAFAAQGAAMVALPFLLNQTLGRDIAEVGMLIAPWPIMGACLAPFSGKWSDRMSAGLLGVIGLALLATGLLCVSWLPAGAPMWTVMLPMALCGTGFGLFLSPNQRFIMFSVPSHRASVASGLSGLARLLGQTMGAAFVAACFTFNTDAGATWALWAAVAFALAGCVASGMLERITRHARHALAAS